MAGSHKVVKEKRAAAVAKKKRRCMASGCNVALSSYNKGEFCARHAHLAPVPRFRAS
jgi:hypothetical protein